MLKFFGSRTLFYVGSFAACGMMAMTTGCASGGFNLTRQYARWVNSQMIILRIILYILTSVVFAVTMLIDMVIFNTLDFWNGRVSAGDYKIEDGGDTYFVKHEFLPGTSLKRSTIRKENAKGTVLQNVVLSETTSGEIELYVDGKLRSRVTSLTGIPVATLFNENGTLLKEELLLVPHPMERNSDAVVLAVGR